LKALLLSAGPGTRLRPWTDDRPKSMVVVSGRPFIERTIEWLREAGIRELIINLHHFPSVVTDHLGDGARFGVSIVYSREPRLMGTAGAVAHAMPLIGRATFLVVYADNLIRLDLAAFLAEHRELAAVMTFALHERENVTSRGVAEIGEDRLIRSFVEKPSPGATTSHWVNAGLYACQPDVLDRIPATTAPDFGRDVIPAMLKRRDRVAGYLMREPDRLLWIDTPDDLARAEMELGQGMPA
jgi:mannose-1-phosphate guanylyltransferase